MITPLTLQQVFDNALLGIRSQDYVKCEDDGCVYFGGNGLHCGIGWSIPVSIYSPSIEGHGIDLVLSMSTKLKALFEGVESSHLVRLQGIHDGMSNPTRFESRMRDFARKRKLLFTEIKS